MDLQTIELPRAEARERFIEYRHAVHRRHDDEDAAIMRGYRAMARGSALISLSACIQKGGVDNRGRPRLAVGKATATKVYLASRLATGSVTFCTKLYQEGRAPNNSVDVRTLPAGTLPVIPQDRVDSVAYHDREAVLGIIDYEARNPWATIMPNVPPRFRPARGLHLYDVLFEVDKWSRANPVVTRDPALIRRLAGDLYVVCAQWDLTDLERHVLAGRAR
jgi:hypothetical protein